MRPIKSYTFAEFQALPSPIRASIIAEEDAEFHSAIKRALNASGLELQAPDYTEGPDPEELEPETRLVPTVHETEAEVD